MATDNQDLIGCVYLKILNTRY